MSKPLTETISGDTTINAPYPGSHAMPRWNVGELPDAPRFEWKNWWHMLGPGLLMGGAAIGGGEWLTGPLISAKYGGSLLWLATLSIVGQVIYNIEISRYALYTGEPIFTGKFRIPPGPMFWVALYLVLDFGTFFPYLAANAATPLASIILGDIPDVEHIKWHETLLRSLSVGVFLLALVPIIFGGKIYDSLKAVMTFKIVAVMGFLLLLAIGFSTMGTWVEIFGGFFKFGTVPIERPEDLNGNGILDPGEDWDGDGKLDGIEEKLKPGPDGKYALDDNGKPILFRDVDGDGIRDGDNVDNIFSAILSGRALPKMDLSTMALLSALIAISGQGGLTNTPISNYTRDSGWGMGSHVGAIPSLVGGHNLQLSHVGTVFIPSEQSLARWKKWCRVIFRDQLLVWMPACFFGLALPTMLSIVFLKRGTMAPDEWKASVLTASAVGRRVGESLGESMGSVALFTTLFCGFLVFAPSMATTIDGFVRRWVDVFWTASKSLHSLEPHKIKHLYFGVLFSYAICGTLMLLFIPKPTTLLTIASSIYNFALGFSCWHVVAVNTVLLPKPLRSSVLMRIALALTGLFFWCVAMVSAYQQLLKWDWFKQFVGA